MLSSLEHFDSYIRGSSSSSLEKYLEFYDEKPAILNRDFHDLKIFANAKTSKAARSILKNLNIPEDEWDNYDPNLTIYEFLLQLARDDHPQVDFIIHLINKKSRISRFKLILGGGILISFAFYLLLQPAFQFVIDALINFFSMVISFPIIGLVFNCILFTYYYIKSDFDKKKTDFNRHRDNIFLILSTLPTIAAYIILIATSAAMSPVIAWLYIASAAVDVLREFFCLNQEIIVYMNHKPFDLEDPLNVHRAQKRRNFGYEKRRNALGLNFAAAILIVTITALWCFLPGGIPATIFALSAIGIVHLIKLALIRRNEADLREELQIELQQLEKVEKKVLTDKVLSFEYGVHDRLEAQSDFYGDEQSLDLITFLPRPKPSSIFSTTIGPFFNRTQINQEAKEKELELEALDLQESKNLILKDDEPETDLPTLT